MNAAIRSTPEVANGAVAYFAHLDALTRPIRYMQQRLEARMFRDTEPYLARATYVSDLGEEGKDRARNASPAGPRQRPLWVRFAGLRPSQR